MTEIFVQYISDLNQFKDVILSMLSSAPDLEILISGTFAVTIFGELINKVKERRNIYDCKVLIPNVINRDGLSKHLINGVHKLGGRIKVSGNSNNNIIVIGKHVFMISLSYKNSRDQGLRTNFESCMCTNCEKTVATVKNILTENWNKSFPLAIEGAEGDTL